MDFNITYFETGFKPKTLEPVVHGPTRWHMWEFDPKYYTLTNLISGYEIDLEKVGSVKDIEFWLKHMHGKILEHHGGKEMLDELSDALQTIFLKHQRTASYVWDATKACKKYAALARRATRQLSPHQRFNILERDEFCCQLCGKKAPDVELEVDHKHPRSRGGTNAPENLWTLCKTCNLGKSDRVIDL